MVGTTALTVLALRLLLGMVVDTGYRKDEVLRNMHLSRAALPMKVVTEPPAPQADTLPALQRIRDSGVLRVAFVADRVPFAFVNARGELVGLGVDLAERLARDLGATRVEFVPADYRQMAQLLAERRVDIATGIALPARTAAAGGLLGALSRQHAWAWWCATNGGTTSPTCRRCGRARRSPWACSATCRASSSGCATACPASSCASSCCRRRGISCRATRRVSMPSPCWPNPAPHGRCSIRPFPSSCRSRTRWPCRWGWPLRRGEHELAGFVNDWLVIQRASGALKQARDYWVLGRGAQPEAATLVDPARRAGMGPSGRSGARRRAEPMISHEEDVLTMKTFNRACRLVAVRRVADGLRPVWRGLGRGRRGAGADAAAQYRRWIVEMKDSPRGPFSAIKWFCRDGRVLPPQDYACAGKDKGWQHGEWSERTRQLRAQGFQVANLLAGIDADKVVADPAFPDLYAQWLVEKFLIAADDGWILRKAQFYRGAIQEEDEREGARRLLTAMSAQPAWIGQRFVALRTGVRLLPHGADTASAQKVRNMAAALADRDPEFQTCA